MDSFNNHRAGFSDTNSEAETVVVAGFSTIILGLLFILITRTTIAPIAMVNKTERTTTAAVSCWLFSYAIISFSSMVISSSGGRSLSSAELASCDI